MTTRGTSRTFRKFKEYKGRRILHTSTKHPPPKIQNSPTRSISNARGGADEPNTNTKGLPVKLLRLLHYACVTQALDVLSVWIMLSSPDKDLASHYRSISRAAAPCAILVPIAIF